MENDWSGNLQNNNIICIFTQKIKLFQLNKYDQSQFTLFWAPEYPSPPPPSFGELVCGRLISVSPPWIPCRLCCNLDVLGMACLLRGYQCPLLFILAYPN